MVSYNPSTNNDVSAAAGLRKIFENWNFDLNTYGKNRFDYNIQTLQMRP
jgi:hypothetical protein